MVKGNSRQVIVVHNPDPKLFEQAIFIIKDEAVAQGITDELLLKEARQAIRGESNGKNDKHPIWAAIAGAAVTGFLWLLATII